MMFHVDTKSIFYIQPTQYAVPGSPLGSPFESYPDPGPVSTPCIYIVYSWADLGAA